MPESFAAADIAAARCVAALGAHPDDEIIGPGGFLHRLSRQGAEVHVVTFTCGGTAAASEAEADAMVRRRTEEMREADRILGITARHVLGIPSQQVPRAVTADNALHRDLIRLIREVRPDLVLTHSRDNHRDHCAVAEITPQAVFQAGERILGSLGEPWATPVVLYYGVERDPPDANVVVRIAADDLDAKLAALRTQLSQARDGYLARMEQIVRARAELWGARQFGAGALAEPFRLDPSHPLPVV